MSTRSPAVVEAVNQGKTGMNSAAHIVVVDDEIDIRKTLEEYLGLQGFRVSCADGGAALREIVENDSIDIVVLDINMPGEDGLSLARFLRENTRVGILMLTAAGEVVDRIVGLEIGADDYISKPVDLRELLARIKAVLRRVSRSADPEASRQQNTRVAFGDCRLDMDAHKLYGADGNEISITSMEFDLLKAFAEHPDRVLNRDQLLELAHNRDWDPFDRSIDIRIARLRKKIERVPSKPEIIKTVRGTGYIFSPRER